MGQFAVQFRAEEPFSKIKTQTNKQGKKKSTETLRKMFIQGRKNLKKEKSEEIIRNMYKQKNKTIIMQNIQIKKASFEIRNIIVHMKTQQEDWRTKL